jgi:hypothetical protein
MHDMHLLCSVAMRPNLELKTQPKQLLGSLLLDIVLLEIFHIYNNPECFTIFLSPCKHLCHTLSYHVL